MKRSPNPIATTLIGGLIFMVPVVIIVVIVMEAYDLMIFVAEPMSDWIPTDTIAGIATANLLAAVELVVVCYLAGLVATSKSGARFQRALDQKLLLLFPRYSFLKATTAEYGSGSSGWTMNSVLVRFDDLAQIGFEVDRNGGNVSVYLPGSPDPWTGVVIHVAEERVTPLKASFNEISESLRQSGKNISRFLG